MAWRFLPGINLDRGRGEHEGCRAGAGRCSCFAAVALFASTGTSHAGLDNELNVVDGKGRNLVIQQWDTFLNGVYPLDRNRLTREWFHTRPGDLSRDRPGCG